MELNKNVPNVACPSPEDFVTYLPWVCYQLSGHERVVVKRVFREEYVSADVKKTRGKFVTIPSATNVPPAVYRKDPISRSQSTLDQEGDTTTIKIIAVYSGDNLVEIKFYKIKQIPAIIFQIIGLISQFYINLSCISINSGLNQQCLYELTKLVSLCNITDICLDGTFLLQANYFLLLEKETRIKHLSLSRCSIDDVVLEKITSKLKYPLPASHTLSILNLSVNRITDIGAISLAHALRSNRQLSYLNLSSNMLTDAGAGVILDTLKEFPMDRDEIKESRSRLMLYLKEKNSAIAKLLAEFKEENEKFKKTPARHATGKRVKTMEHSSRSIMGSFKEAACSESMLFKKADMAAQANLRPFKDPFSAADTVIKDGLVNSIGNTSLCYLNLAYNNLSYLSLKKILTVLNYQSNVARTSRRTSIQSFLKEGLIKVNIEGNPMPIECEIFSEIEQILKTRIYNSDRKTFSSKKR